MSGIIIGRPWIHHLKKGWTWMKIYRGSMGECSMCGMATIGYKFGCLISLKFIHMTSLSNCSGFHHIGYERRPHPLCHYYDKHEQVRFKLNNMDFKILVLSIFFLFLAFYIEVEVFYQFCFNPPSMLNLITWSLVWSMVSSASKASAWFHWSNSRMWSVPMSIKDVKTSQGRFGIL
jgi:hypothetical protein